MSKYDFFLPRARQASDVLRSYGFDWQCKLGEPATDDSIKKCEDFLGIPLSPSHREFLELWNGAILSDAACDWYDIRILSIDEIINYTTELRNENYEESPFKGLIVCADILEGDYIVSDPEQVVMGEYRIIEAYHGEPEDWKTSYIIAESFLEWIMKIFDSVVEKHKPPQYWIPGEIEAIPSLDRPQKKS